MKEDSFMTLVGNLLSLKNNKYCINILPKKIILVYHTITNDLVQRKTFEKIEHTLHIELLIHICENINNSFLILFITQIYNLLQHYDKSYFIHTFQ